MKSVSKNRIMLLKSKMYAEICLASSLLVKVDAVGRALDLYIFPSFLVRGNKHGEKVDGPHDKVLQRRRTAAKNV